MMQRDIAPPRSAMLEVVGLDVALGLALGAVAAPILRARRGDIAHMAVVAAAWAALGLVAGLPALALHRTLLVVPWLAAPALVAGSLWVARRWRRLRWVPLAIGTVVVGATLAAPEIVRRGPAAPDVGAHARPGAPDVLLVVLDTVRADHVGAYGYERPTTPRFDGLARGGALYLDATAPATWSLPSHASLFTGRFPSRHGAHSEHRYLDDAAPTLAELLAAHGYDTRCFTANAWISDELGLTRGFAWADDAWRDGVAGRTRFFPFRVLDRLGFGARDNGGSVVAEHFESWAESSPLGARPTFAFVNFIEAHFPYHQLPDEYLDRFGDASRDERRALSLALLEAQFGGEPPDPARYAGLAADMYDAGVSYADHLLGRLVAALRRRGTLDSTVIVVLADHGELLGEHGAFGHGNSVHEIETRVPLLVRYPPRIRRRTRVETPISTAGVLATILDLAGVEAPRGLDVSSLLAPIDGGPPAGPVISERFSGDAATARAASVQAADPLMRTDRRFRAFREGDLKLVEASDGARYLFDLASDPGELHDVARARPDDVSRLAGDLEAWRAATGMPDLGARAGHGKAPSLDAETRERLRALGYDE